MGLKINGTIKQYIKAKEFGFIAPDDGSKDVLVELRDFKGVWRARGTKSWPKLTISQDVKTLSEGQKVEYEIVDGPTGPKAIEVVIVE
jgi:CspA family cold shock protein